MKKNAGKAVSVSYNWAKKNKGKFIKAADITADFLGIKDGYILLTGKDFNGKKASRLQAGAWLIAGFTPASKAAKAAKIAGKAVKNARPIAKAGRAIRKSGVTKKVSRGISKSKRIAPKIKRAVPKPKIVKKVWVVTERVMKDGSRKLFKQPMYFIQKRVAKKKSTTFVGNRAQRRAANKKAHSGSKKDKNKLNKQRQKKNKNAKQARKKNRNAKSKKNSKAKPPKKKNANAKDPKKKQTNSKDNKNKSNAKKEPNSSKKPDPKKPDSKKPVEPVKPKPTEIADGAKDHMVKAEPQKNGALVTTKKGVKGAHNENDFYAALKSAGYDLNKDVKMVKTPVPGQPGLTDITYQYKETKIRWWIYQ